MFLTFRVLTQLYIYASKKSTVWTYCNQATMVLKLKCMFGKTNKLYIVLFALWAIAFSITFVKAKSLSNLELTKQIDEQRVAGTTTTTTQPSPTIQASTKQLPRR